MLLRRSIARTTGALVLALGGLTACGFDLATDRPYTPGVGAQDISGDVSVLAATIVAAQPNEGTLIAAFDNSLPDAAVTLGGVSSAELEIGDFDSIEIDPRGYVNLGEVGGIPVTGDFDAGDVIVTTLDFSNGESITLNVPVVRACNEYLGLDETTDSENIPYDCNEEPPHEGGH